MAQVQELLFGDDKSLVMDWMLGSRSAEDINQFVAEATGIPFGELWDIFVHDCRTMDVPKDVLARLSALRDSYVVILITGNMDSFSRFTVPALKLNEYFDHISNSYDEGRHKTDDEGAIFLSYSAKYQVPIAQCMLIDDSSGACSLFEKLSGNAYLITSDNDISHYLTMLENG